MMSQSKTLPHDIIGSMLEKRLVAVLCAVLSGFALLFSFVIAPLTVYANTDGTIGIDYLPDILDLVNDLLTVSVHSFCYAVTIYAIYRFGMKRAAKFITVTAVLTVIRYTLNIVTQFYVFDTRPDAAELFTGLKATAYNTLSELVQYGLTVLCAYLIINKALMLLAVARKNADKLGNFDFSEHDTVFSSMKLFSLENPLVRSAFFSGVIVASLKIASRLIYDINYGLPQDTTDLLWMLTYYGSDILSGLLAYFLVFLFILKCDTAELKATPHNSRFTP